jgi:dGTPase
VAAGDSDPLTARFEQEKPSTHRSEAERDHDRILYTSAFQRLAGITQIAAPDLGTGLHNRLTHTLKVAQVARRTAKQLRLDTDGQETAAAAALAHDLGHPPFGHLAEEVLNDAAKGWGGFEGNAQSFRIVTFLAARGSGYRGLNLTRRTLNAILKYPWTRDETVEKKRRKWGAYKSESDHFDFARDGSDPDQRSLEAAIMDWSDDVTYAVHDLEDFFRVGLIPLQRLVDPGSQDRREFVDSFFDDPRGRRTLRNKFADDGLNADDIAAAVEWVFGGAFAGVEPYRGSKRDRAALRSGTSYLIGEFVEAISLENGKVAIDKAHRARVAVLKEIAWHYVVEDPSLATIQHGQRQIIRELHNIYLSALDDPDKGFRLFPLAQREDLPFLTEYNDRCRLVTDFVAGLTEEMAYELYHRLTGVTPGSILDAAARASR